MVEQAITELNERAANVATRMRAVADVLEKAVDEVDTATAAMHSDGGTTPHPGVLAAVTKLVDALFAASAAGEAAATPVLTAGEPELEVLLNQARASVKTIRERTDAPDEDSSASMAADTLTIAKLAQARRRAQDRVEKLCRLRLPLLTDAPVPDDVRDQLSDPTRLTGAKQPEIRSWLFDHARVNPPINTLLAAYDLAEALGAVDLQMTACHLPAPTGTEALWAGADTAPPPGTVNLVVARADPHSAAPAIVRGLSVDAWTQTVAHPTRTTGVAFHYDEPNATPPQAMLVAVAPDLTPGTEIDQAGWGLGTLLDTLTGTLAMARDRAVPAETMSPSGITVTDIL